MVIGVSQVPILMAQGVDKYPNPKPETLDPKPETRDPKPATQDPKPGTRNPEPGSQHLVLPLREVGPPRHAERQRQQ